MKAMLLAAGRGERMGALTNHCPKPLLSVAGKPLIEYHIERLASAGFSQIVINVCYLADQIMDQLGDGARWGVSIQYSRESVCLETGGGISRALPLLTHGTGTTENAPFLVLNSDVWTGYPFENLVSVLNDSCIDRVAHLVLVPNPDHNAEGDFSLVSSGTRRDRSMCTTVPSVGNQFTFSGVSVLRPSLFANCSAERFALAPLLREAMLQQAVSGELYSECWIDVGTPERLDLVNRMLDGNV